MTNGSRFIRKEYSHAGKIVLFANPVMPPILELNEIYVVYALVILFIALVIILALAMTRNEKHTGKSLVPRSQRESRGGSSRRERIDYNYQRLVDRDRREYVSPNSRQTFQFRIALNLNQEIQTF